MAFAHNVQLQGVVAGSSKNTFYTSKQRWMQLAMKKFKSWARHHGLPEATCENWHLHMQTQWNLHYKQLQDNPNNFKFNHVVRIKKDTECMVVHNEDHAPTKFMLYCPCLYYKLVQATFGDKAIFKKHEIEPATLHDKLSSLCPKTLCKKYAWGFNWSNPLPYSYVFAKSKKAFTTARPVISFCNSPFSKIFTAVSKCLFIITKICYPTNLHVDDVFQTFFKLHKYVQHCQHPQDLELHNDDLIGFYTSVQAVQHMLSVYVRMQPAQRSPIMFTVDINQKDTRQRLFRGKTRTHSKNSYVIHLLDIQELVQLSLQTSFFVSMGTVYTQVRGSCIGSQISPALCNITVALEEVMWQNTMTCQIHSMGFFTRYVDNRLAILSKTIQASSPFHQFLQLDFYKDPVTLEEVGDLHFLGFNVDVQARTVTYIVPVQEFKYRLTNSAGSVQMALTGAVSRLHTICRCTWPRAAIPRSCNELAAQYVKLGANKTIMQQCVTRIISKYRLKST